MNNQSEIDKDGTSSTVFITLPDKLWLGKLSREEPYFEYEIKSFIPIQTDPFMGNSLIRISGNNIRTLRDKLQNFISLKQFFILDESPTHLSLNTHTYDQLLLKAIVEHMIIVHFPIKIQKGVAEFNITSSREALHDFLSDLDGKFIDYQVKTIENYSDEDLQTNLTPKQFETYMKAKESGYYDIPRKITLTELADKLGVAKSSLSSMLQRIHKKLLGK